jgi:two-component system OmpR family sensor kinase
VTRRLILWLTVTVVVFWLGAALLGAAVMRHEFDEVFDSALAETGQRLLPLVLDELAQHEDGDDDKDDGEPWTIEPGDIPDHYEYLSYQVRSADGRVLLRSHDADREPFAAPLERGYFDTSTARIYTLAGSRSAIFLQVADPLGHRVEAVTEGALALILPLVALIPLSMGAIWLIVRRALAPVTVLRSAIGDRNGMNLAPLNADGLPVELANIAVAVDDLLRRLRTALEAERQFAANSAHELRTPIAGALVQTQRLIAELPDGAARERAAGIEESLVRLTRLSEKLLQLARAESGIGLAAEPTDLVPVLRMVVGDFARSVQSRGRIRLDVAPGTRLERAVDVDAFAIVLRNLVENALIHGATDEPVRVTVDPEGIVSVRNGGPVIPAERLRELTGRFRRGDTAGLGAGLGLAIADSFARHMGGRLELRSPPNGEEVGFETRLVLS